MTYYYVGIVNHSTIIFGQGNTQRTAIAAGEYNSKRFNATHCRVVNKLPAGAAWFDCL